MALCAVEFGLLESFVCSGNGGFVTGKATDDLLHKMLSIQLSRMIVLSLSWEAAYSGQMCVEIFVQVKYRMWHIISNYYPSHSGRNLILLIRDITDISCLSDSDFRDIYSVVTKNLQVLRNCHDLNVFCQCNSSSRRPGWSYRDGGMSFGSHWFHRQWLLGNNWQQRSCSFAYFALGLDLKPSSCCGQSLLLRVC